jgi:uncharacterized protein YdhG (YjbR/CyaY superfamily)
MNETKKSAKGAERASTTKQRTKVFSDVERDAMVARAQEVKAESRRGKGGGKADAEQEVLAKIADMPEPDRRLAERIHAIVREAAPGLEPRTWYGMPAYARDGKVVCFFTAADKFKSRYATFGFEEAAKLDDGPMWATAFALTELTSAVEARIAELVTKAAG